MNITGRMPRGTFWKLYVIWQPIAIVLTWAFAPSANDVHFYLKLYCLYAICHLPLFLAGAQGLQDVGETGQQIIYPLVPFGILFFATYGMYYVFFRGATALHSVPDAGAQTLGATLAVIGATYGLLFYLLIIPVVLIATVATCMITSTIMGLCLLPSDPTENTYGPNPNEVTQ